MSIPAQISANQRNGQLSTGPLTGEGKAVSSQNGVTHGLSSAFTVLACESQSEFDALARRLHEEFQPEGEHEGFLVDRMAQSRWRMERIGRLETAAFDYMLLPDEAESASFEARIIASLSKNGRDPLSLLERYKSAAERSYYKAHRELQQGRRANEKMQAKAMDNYIKTVVFGPLPGELDRAVGFASQNDSRGAGANGFVSRNPAAAPVKPEDLAMAS